MRDPRFVLPPTLALLLLGLAGCGEQQPLTDDEVDRIALKTADYLRPIVADETKRLTSEIRAELARLPARPAADASARPVPTLAPPIPTRLAAAPTPAAPPAPATPGAAPAGPDPKGVVLAEIGDEALTLADLERLRGQDKRLASRPVDALLKDLVRFRLMAKAAAASGLPDSDPRLKAVVEDRKADFRHELMLKDRLAVLPPILDADLKQLFESRADDFTERARMQVSEIVVAERAQAEALAKELTKDNFAELARKHSSGASGKQGGGLGWVSKERLPKEGWESLETGGDGAVTGPFQGPDSLHHLFLRTAYQAEKRPTFEEALPKLRAAAELSRREAISKELTDRAAALWPAVRETVDLNTATDPELVVLRIGPRAITLAEFNLAYQALDGRRAQLFPGAEGKKRFLDLLVERYQISNLAITDAGFLERHEPHIRDVERQLLINYYTEKNVYPNTAVSEDQILARYEKEKDERFRTPPNLSYRAKHILFRVDPKAPEKDQADAREKALAALDRIRKGEEFGAVALELGDKGDPSTARRGDLGPFGPGRMVKPFEQGFEALKVWQVTSEPVRTDFGLHLILREPAATHLGLAEVKDFLRNLLTEEGQRDAIDKFLTKVAEQYPVRTFPDRLPGSQGSTDPAGNVAVPPTGTGTAPAKVIMLGKDGVPRTLEGSTIKIKDGQIVQEP